MTNIPSFSDPIFPIQNKRIICVGDVMLDRFIYGSVDRISPEAPVPVFHINRTFNRLGGAANVLYNLSHLGVQTVLMGRIGEKDAASEDFLNILQEMDEVLIQNTTPHLLREGKTIVKTRFSAQAQQLFRVDDEVIAPPSQKGFNYLQEIYQKELPFAQAVILSDYAKGLLTPQYCQYAIQLALQNHIPVIVDPKGSNYEKYRGATLISPNLKEFTQAVSFLDTTYSAFSGEQWDNESIEKAAKALLEAYDFQSVLVTRSEKGMSLITRDMMPFHLSAEVREVFDVSGAGDTVIATIAAGISMGQPLEQAVDMANRAAGIVVGKSGTAAITADELNQAMRASQQSLLPSKVMGIPLLMQQIQDWRRQGLSIGFTNGCFDLLHSGHITLLSSARKECDRLIVGLNTDKSIQRLKGPTRPIQGESVRALVLSHLSCVDGVVLFGEDTPLQLIQQIIPDVLIKGSDYTVETVVGHEIVQAHGGRVHLVNLLPGHSTSKTVETIKGKP